MRLVVRSQKRPSMCQKRPSMCQKRPSVCQKRPSVCQKRPIAMVLSDAFSGEEVVVHVHGALLRDFAQFQLLQVHQRLLQCVCVCVCIVCMCHIQVQLVQVHQRLLRVL
jgi:hypothetical protein